MITLLATSALRSLLLGLMVWSALKLFRLRDTRSETLIWTLVLAASLAMPFLTRELPGGIALPLQEQAALPAPAAAVVTAAQSDWLALHIATLFWSFYASVALVSVLRLVAGLLLCLKLYRQGEPLIETWTRGRNVRANTAIDAPLSFGTAILVPADCHDWSAAKRLAVMAHEEAHVRRGDFFIQLLAGFHRAIFWFNPFAWWLLSHLRELAETASDNAAIQELNDAASYAEILLEVSCRAQRGGAALAMACGPGISKRVDHILSGVTDHAIGHAARAFAVLAVLLTTATIAGAHAKEAPALAALPVMRVPESAVRPLFVAAVPMANTASPTHFPDHAGTTAAAHRSARTRAAIAEPEITFNPRALLEPRDVVVLPAIVPASSKGHDSYLLDGNTYVGGN